MHSGRLLISVHIIWECLYFHTVFNHFHPSSGSLTDLQSGAGPHSYQDLQASQQSHLSAVQSHLNFQRYLLKIMFISRIWPVCLSPCVGLSIS